MSTPTGKPSAVECQPCEREGCGPACSCPCHAEGDSGDMMRGAAAWQLQVRIVCLECGGGADDEHCIGPFFAFPVLETDPAEFTQRGHGTLADFEGPTTLPMAFDAEGNDLPDHPIMRVLRGHLELTGLPTTNHLTGKMMDCPTCNGDKFVEPIGGYDPGEPGDPCPTCNPKRATA